MVSNKTGDFIEYNIYLEYKKKHEDVLLKYSTINSSRKWELSTSIAKQQVYEKLYLTFQDCILGYGNYSQPRSSIIRTKSNFFIF
jgi:HSP90 family molecular chaperone